MSNTFSEVVIIGGGITGLAAAFELARTGNDVTLVEADKQLGGVGAFFKSGNQWVDRFYHCQMPSDEYLLKLIRDVGVADKMYWNSTHMGFIVDGNRYPFNTPLDVLRFKPLTFMQRLRFGIMSLLIRRLGKGLDLDNIKIEDWFSRLYSPEVWGKILKPLFCSKFGTHGGNLPALYIWQRLGRESNVAKRGYIDGGLKTIIDAIESNIKSSGGAVKTRSPVRSITEFNSHMRVMFDNNTAIDCDWVLSTIPIPLLKETIKGSRLDDLFQFPDIPYQGVVNALFFLSRPLDNLYWSPVVNSDTEFDGVVEMTELVKTSQYDGRHLVYVMKYCGRDSKLFSEDKETLIQRWSDELIKLYSNIQLKKEDILEVEVFKSPYIEPIYPLGYSNIKPDFRVGDSHLVVATTAQIYPSITSCNASVKLATDAVTYLRRLDSSIQ